MQIKKIKLNNKTEIPSMGLGTWQLTGSQCLYAVKKALELGYRHIDTAESYSNETEIVKAIKEFFKSSKILREKLFITSKAWPDKLDYYGVLAACEQSLARLETHYLDLYLLHWPSRNLNYKEIFKAFKILYEKGKIKAFGVSNFTINHLKDAIPICKKLKLPLSVNQVEFHPLLYQKELLDFCNKNNIVITAYCPLARGKISENKLISELASRYKKTPEQISLKWLLEKNIVVIPKSSSEKHLKENLNLNFSLSKEDINKIDNITEHEGQERLIVPSFAEFDY
ncbi:MAG: aldo/keto reductase [Nanoarchaeota archaeon]